MTATIRVVALRDPRGNPYQTPEALEARLREDLAAWPGSRLVTVLAGLLQVAIPPPLPLYSVPAPSGGPRTPAAVEGPNWIGAPRFQPAQMSAVPLPFWAIYEGPSAAVVQAGQATVGGVAGLVDPAGHPDARVDRQTN